ncbi:MAG: GEVED domain-containing protein [Nocardioidaceae bacterium]
MALVQVLGLLVFFLAFFTLSTESAQAYEVPTGNWSAPGSSNSSTVTYPSGITVNVATTGTSTVVAAPSTLGARGFDVTQFTPTTMLTGDSAATVTVNTGDCAATGTCSSRGTTTFTFSQPVRNPIIHLAGIGGASRNGNNQSDLHSIWDLTTPGVTISKLDGNTQLSVTGGTRITATNDSTSVNCTTNANGTGFFDAGASAACGSIQVNGTVTTVAFSMTAVLVKNPNAQAANNNSGSSDAVGVVVTLPQDFSDAPVSYNPTQAPAHVISNLTLGSSVDEDNVNTRNATASPYATAAANGDDTDSTDDENAFTTLPSLSTQPNATYSLTVPIAGLSKAANLCGWVDFNRNGTFDTTERACATPAGGATSASLSWTTPSGMTSGTSYARFRLGYTQAQIQSPTGVADSGEVEDYPVTILERPQIILRKTTLATTGGPFAFTLTNTVQTTGSVTTSAAGTPTQVDGDTGTAGTQAYTVASQDQAVTINESTLPGGWSLSTATCTDAGGATVGSLSGSTYTVPGAATAPGAVVTCTFTNGQPSISLTKTAGAITDLDANGTDQGDTIAYSFLVTNTGQVALSSVAVNDPKISSVSCPSSTLAVGASQTCTATYTITLADMNAGVVNNTATATGTPPTGSAVTATSSASKNLPANPSVTLDKTHGTITDLDANGQDAGDTVVYSFLVTNTGNVTLTSVGVTDAKVGTVSCPATTLNPGASTTCTATYTLTQADVNTGSVNNTATASGTPPTGAAVTATDTDTLAITRTRGITLDKVAGTPSGNTAGSTIAYTFLVTNTGNTTLTSVNVTDAKVGSVSCPLTTLAPGQSTTCTATYTLTQTDVNAGVVNNTATATGTPPSGLTAPTATDSTSTTITRTPGISLDKQSGGLTDVDGNGPDVGDTIAYSFVISNTGNVTLTSVGVTDAKVGPITCTTTTLAPGAATTCTKTYTLTQADVDSGHVANTATATGTPPSGLTAPISTDSTDTTVTAGPKITLVKTAGTPSGNTAGSTIAYSFLVTNTGNVTLTSVGVSDPKVGAVTCPVTTLAPGASTTCTKTYTLTQADVNAGSVTNTATASGTPPTGAAVSATSSTTTTIVRTSTITLDKQAGTPTGNTAGSTIAYSFVVTNTGNVTLTGVNISDAKVTSISCPVTTLAPGATTTCTATYTITQADVNSGHVANTATATGTPPAGVTAPTASDSTDTAITRTTTITLDKQAAGITDVDGNGPDAGDTIAYSFVVTNTGNVTLTSVGVTDAKVGAVTCPATTLAPGVGTVCTKTYTLTQADVDSGHVANTASATGTPPAGMTAPTATDSTDTAVTAGPAITLDKQAGTPSGNTAGSTIAYSFVVTNTGNVTLTSVGVTDAKVGAVTCPATTLAPGASTTCTKTYTLTQADVDAGVVNNTATASGTPPTGAAVSATDSTSTSITRSPALTFDKQAGTPTGNTAGSTIAYSFVVTNTGNVTLTSVGVTDAKVGAITCPATTLAPGASTTCTKTYTLTQADVDSGHVANTATASGTPPTGAPRTATDSTDTPITAGPAISLTKSAGTPSGNTAGSTIAYSFLVTNTGNVTLTSVGVSDPKVGPVTCPATTLAPGASTTCTKTYTLTQADVDAGVVNNTATASGTPPTGAAVTATSSTSTSITRSPALTFDKQAGTPTGNTAGSTIAYSFVVTNTGNVTLTSVGVTDAKVGAITCPATTLAPGASTTCTKTYTLTQADVDSGHVANTATASGTPPTGAPVTATDSTDTAVTAGPAITLDKQAGAPSGNTAGSTIAYSFVVTNTGNVTLTSVGVTDPKVGAVSCPATTLAPGASTTCTKTYTLTQADVDAGVVNNTATASGTPPTGAAVTATDSTSTSITRSPALTFDKQAGTPSGTTAGSTIAYSFVVTNTGNVTLTSVGVTDAKVGAITCPVTTLAPGASTTCTKTYTLTQADVDSGHVANTATASGTPPTGAPVTATDSTDTPITAGPAITLDKQAGTPSGNTAGSTIAYSFVVTNTGNVTLIGIGINDPKVGAITCPVTTLAPGASTTCTKTYTLTQADVDAGVVNNTATVAGTPPSGGAVFATDSTSTSISRTPSLAVDKQAGTPSGSTAGSTIAYSFVVTNTGNVTVTSVGVTDAKVGAITCPATTLAPGASTTCTATYTLTQADVDSGHVANSATASGTPPSGPATTSSPDTTDTPLTAGPALGLAKHAGSVTDVDGNGIDAGDTIAYSFDVTNTGNVTLSAISITDPKVGAVSCPAGSLAPGASKTCGPTTYTLTQADLDAGVADNTATASGTPPTGAPVTSAPSSTSTPLAAAPALTLDKQSGGVTDLDGNGPDAGDSIGYTFLVTNTGNVTLHAVSIADPQVGAVTCPVATLAPGASTTCTATYTITQADADAGTVSNTATATGTSPTDVDVSDSDTVTTPVGAGPAMTLDKQAGTASGNEAGDTIDYTFLVTNTGTVTLTSVSVSDPKVGPVGCPSSTLAPGASTTCTATYTLTQADVDAGQVVNTATSSGTPPTGPAVTATDSVVTPVSAAPGIAVDKQAGTPSGGAAGDTIGYTFVVTNTGNVTLTSVAVSDPIVGAVTCLATTLAPGASTTCSATYTLTQADVDSGHVANTATVTGTPPNGPPPTGTDSTDTAITPGPSLSLDKQAGTLSGHAAGDTVPYSFLVTNTGNVTLTDITVTDPLAGTVTCPAGSLAPGETATCTASYTLTQADVDAGEVVNTATATGTDPHGTDVSDTDTLTTPVPAEPSISLDKQAGVPSGNTAGDTIAYTFVVTNTGNVTLDSVGVSDPTVGPVTCSGGSLAPGASTTCTASYTLTQTDVDAGHVANTATATATDPNGTDLTATDSTDAPVVSGPAISLVKSDSGQSGTGAGGTVDYDFVVTNTGNVTLTDITIDDPNVGPITCPVTTLAPGATTTCTGTHVVIQAEVDAGVVLNTATVTGTPPSGPDVTDSDSDSTPFPADPSISLDKQAGIPSGNQAGDTIDYFFLVTNTGNVALHAITVDDPQVGAVTCVATTLAAGDSTTCTATYTLTQADVDAGHVANTATVTGTDTRGTDVTANDATDTPVTAGPAITLDKRDVGQSGTGVGGTVDYELTVTNTGNVTLTGIAVDDPNIASVSCPVTTLAPGASTTCTGTHVVTQAEVDAGVVDNTATVTGTPPTGPDVTDTDTNSTPFPMSPSLTLDKQAGTPSGNQAGDTIAYTFLVTNTGNVTLDPVGVDDPKTGPVSCPVTTLAPNAQTTCTSSYTLTQADVDAGHVANTATATGTDRYGNDVTATDNTDTPIASAPALTLDKQAGTPTGNEAGDTIAYTFLVTNTGNVTLDPVGVDDPLVGTVTCPVTTLAPGASTTCTATYTLTQADVDAGTVDNTATASGTPPTGPDATDTDATSTPIAATPSITLDKQAGVPSGSTAGDTVDYAFVVTNTGNVTLDPVGVDDPTVGPVSCPATTLAPGASTTCAATYTLTQADVDAGHVANTATASGTPPTGADVTATDNTDVPLASGPAISLDKQVAAVSGSAAGDTIDFDLVVTNTGNVTLDPVTVDDPLVGAVSCPVSTLAPGASTTCTATYTLTQADVDDGTVDNTATATGTDPDGGDVTATDSTSTVLTADPSISLDKQAGAPSGNQVGDTVDYTFVVTNTGNVTLDGVVIADPTVGSVTCPVATLAPNAQTTCTASYTLTQADVDAGHVANTATVTGTDPHGTDVTATDNTDVAVTAGPAITLDKQAGTPSGAAAGDTIDYTFVVTNTGNVTLTSVSVADPKVGLVTCPVTTLAPGASTTCTATYTMTQADVDAGTVDNTATASGTPPTGPVVTDGDTTSTPIAADPSITLDKQAGTPSGSAAGDTVDYSFVVTNTGNVTLDTVTVDDPTVGPVTCPVTTLVPGASTVCTATYTLTQADVDAGHVANTATVTGTPPTGADVTATDNTDVTLTSGPAISLDKQAAAVSGSSAGDTVDYTFLVTNVGNVTLTGVTVGDPLVAAVDCPVTTLAPGASTTCTATYTLTQADVDAGSVTNTATATGTPPSGPDVTGSDSVGIPVPSAPAVVIDKQPGTPTGNAVGDTVDYTFVVTNTGNVTLTGVAIDDPTVGPVSCPATTLAPTASTTCAATYTLTQADVDAGHVANTATVSGTPPTGPDVTASDSTDIGIAAGPAITLDKQAGTPSGNAAGDTIDYTFLVTNTGNVTLTAVSVDDPLVGPVDCPVATLAPGASTTCTATYTLTQADVDDGTVDNSATATGTSPSGADVTATDAVSTPIAAAPSIALDKSVAAVSGNAAGDTVDYTFLVTNTGNVTLDPVSVADPTVGAVTCPVTTLAPGASTTCTGSYTLTQADVDAGHVANTATVTGTDPHGTDVTATDNTDVPLASGAAVALDKQAGAVSGNAAGDTIDYTFLVTNTGNVTLTAVTVADPLVGPVDCPVTTLAPGASTTCTATYTLTQADVDAGTVDNTATASGTPPTGPDATATDNVSTPIAADPSITLDKQAGTPSGSAAGDTVDYSFVVTNTGNVTLDTVTVDDPTVGPVSCPVTTLVPGASTVCTAAYTLTQADVDAGHVANTATVTGTPPTGADVTATDNTDVTLTSGPAISLDKQAGTPTGTAVGDTIPYSFVVTNVGNVTLTGVTVDDPTVGPVDCPVTTLAPGASTTCTATYTLTQTDVDAGLVTNTATATGTPPSGPDVTGTDAVTTPVTASPSIALDKQAGAPSGNAAGDTIAYTFAVTNTGNVTLTNVGIDDPTTAPVVCLATVLTPGASTTCTASYTLTQADVDAGHVANTATVTGTPPTGADVTATDNTDVTIDAGPAITLDKQAAAPTGTSAGDTVDYTFVVTNTGNVTLTGVSVDDPLVGAVSCPVSTLAPAESTACTATYTLTQADVDAGGVDNTATASGTPPAGPDVTATDSTSTPLPADPSITLDKQVGIFSVGAAGDPVDYTFVVTNTGNVTLDTVTVDDPTVGPVDCPVTTLAPGASTTCTATYTVTQADLDAGHVANTATVTGTDPNGTDVTATDNTDVPLVAVPGLTLDKQAGLPSGGSAGDTVDYSFVVTNTGNVTLAAVAVADPTAGPVDCPVTTLAPGASTTCTATYTLTQADVDAGHVANTATATGTPPTGPDVTATDNTDTPIPTGASITLDKQAGTPTGSDAGDTIAFTFLVTNNGNVTLDTVTIADPTVGAVACPVTTLAPGASTTCTATYTLTQADVDSGSVDNTATVFGNPPTGDPTSQGDDATATDSTSTPLTASGAITLDKQAGTPSGNAVGDTIAYTFVVTNTGNVTLTGVTVDDPLVGAVVCPATTLAPGASTTCTATYTLTQADVDAGVVDNTATVTGTDPGGNDHQASDATSTPIAATPGIDLVKSGLANGTTAGDTIDYTFLVTNTGNVTLTGIDILDPTVGAIDCPSDTLASGASMTCTAVYTIAQGDVDAGTVHNDATVSGTPPTGPAVTASGSVDVSLVPAPGISLDKQAGVVTDLDGNGTDAGDTLDYAFVVTNTGNVSLTAVVVDDPLVGPVSCPVATLAPRATTTCTATYTLTQADVDAGQVVNTATVAGTPPTGPDVTDQDSVTTPVAQTPAITLDKAADVRGPLAVGDQVTYTFTVTNSGNVTLTNLTVSDPMLGGAVDCVVTTLAPGESTTCTAPPYTVTAQDVSRGHIRNHAVATADGGGGAEVEDDDAVLVDTGEAARPAIHLVKRADTDGPVRVGDTIRFTFVVTNTGDVTLTRVHVVDPMLGAVSCPRATLEVGASMTCRADPYTVTANDVRHGAVVNHATAVGSCPRAEACTRVTDGDTVSVDTRTTHGLPDTGSPVDARMPLLALAMLLGGAGLLIAGRRRRN